MAANMSAQFGTRIGGSSICGGGAAGPPGGGRGLGGGDGGGDGGESGTWRQLVSRDLASQYSLMLA